MHLLVSIMLWILGVFYFLPGQPKLVHMQKTFIGVQSLQLIVGRGAVTFKRSDSDSLKVAVRFYPDAITPQWYRQDSSLTIEASYRRKRETDMHDTQWIIYVPDRLRERMQVRASLGAGRMSAERVVAHWDLWVGLGSIELKGSKGTFRAGIGAGYIETRGIEIEGKSRFTATSGHIALHMAAGRPEHIEATALMGQVSFNLASRMQ